jgi:hypothetical protein
MSQGNLQIMQPENETTDSCSKTSVNDEILHSEAPKVYVPLEHEPHVSVGQRTHKWPNTLLGEALLNVGQQKLSCLKQEYARKLHRFFHKNISFFPKSTASCCQTSIINCLSSARFKKVQ